MHPDKHFQSHIHTDWFDAYNFWYKHITVAIIKIVFCAVNIGYWINDGVIVDLTFYDAYTVIQ